MSVTSFSTVVGVFSDQAVAEQAIDALTHAGIASDQIRYLAPGNSGGFFEALKSFFTGEEANGNPIHDLSHMGLSGSEVQYYSEAYNQGYTILAVNTSGYPGDVRGMLHHYGAYTPGFFPVPAGATAENTRQPEDVSAQEAENIKETPIYQSTMDAPMVKINAVKIPPTDDGTLGEVDEAEITETSEADADTLPDLTPVEVSNTDADTLPDLRSVEADGAGFADVHTDALANPAPVEVDDEITETPDAEEAALGATPVEVDEIEVMDTSEAGDEAVTDVTPVETDENNVAENDDPDDEAALGATPVEVDEIETSDTDTDGADEDETPDYQNRPDQSVTPVYQPTAYTAPEQIFEQSSAFQSDEVHPQQTNTLQQMQNQIQTTRQQLQEAKAELEALKQHESQYTEAQQQLQTLQAELQATQLELQEAKERVAQYN